MAETASSVSAFHAGRQILASGAMIVSRGAPPLVLSCDGSVLVIHLDVTEPYRLDNGLVVGGRTDELSIAPDETKTAPVGDALATYTLHPHRPDMVGPDAAGRWGPTMWLLLWEVSRPAPGMAVPAKAPPDYGVRSRDPSTTFA